MTNPYGQPVDPYAAAGPYAGVPDRRPGTVTAASIITVVLSALAFLAGAASTLLIVVNRDSVVDEINKRVANDDIYQDFSADELANIATGVVAVVAVWALIALVLGVLTMKGHNWARITLVVSAAVTALVSLLSITSLVSFVTLAGAIAVIVLLFTGGAGAWFAARKNA